MRQAGLWLAYGRDAIGILAALGLALALAGCSSSSRFDFPSFGLTSNDSAGSADMSTTAAVPMPSEPVYSSGRYQYYGERQGDTQLTRKTQPPPSYTPTPAAYTPSAPVARPKPQAPAPRPEPAVVRTPDKPQSGFQVTVAKGDTLSSLSRRYAVPVEAIMSANDLPDGRLSVGKKLVIPTGSSQTAAQAPAAPAQEQAAAPTAGKTYKVEKGDTPHSIAEKLGVDEQALIAKNDIRPDRLQIGQVLAVPSAGADQTPTPATKDGQSPVRVVKTTTIKPPGSAGPATTAPEAVKASPDVTGEGQSRLARIDQLPSPDPMSGNSFRWPVKGRIISTFGTESDGEHNDGINLSVPQGTSVKAAENGVVAYAGNELKGYGNLVLVRHANSWVSAYAHNEELLVKRGDKVRRGQIIAKAGATGSVSQPQVHFELRKGSRPVDPTKYMSDMTAASDD